MDNRQEFNMELLMHVIYKVKEGKRDEFIHRIKESGIMTASQQEPGNLCYEYYYPIDDGNSVLLIESWTNVKAQQSHCKTEHFKKLSEIKSEYVQTVDIKKYLVSDKV